MKCCVYILKSLTNEHYYIGSSIDPIKRKIEHNQGKTKSTRDKGPWRLVFSQKFENVNYARRIENRLKKMKNRVIIEKIIRDGVIKMLANGD